MSEEENKKDNKLINLKLILTLILVIAILLMDTLKSYIGVIGIQLYFVGIFLLMISILFIQHLRNKNI